MDIKNAVSLLEGASASPAISKLANLMKSAGIKVTMDAWKDGSMGISIRHEMMDFQKGIEALQSLDGDITRFKKRFLKGSFSYKGNEYIFQPYKGYTFVMSLTD